MANTLEVLTGETWEEFLGSENVVLTLGKTDCAACVEFEGELKTFLSEDETWEHVRFGKIVLDTRGLHAFKKASPWLREVDSLPYTVIMKDGEHLKAFAGGGVDRLVKRLGKTLA